MKKLHTILFAFFFGFCGFSQSPFLNITYTGNEGFLLESENKKVLIDALFKANYPDFLDPSEKMINQMINGKPPYDNLDLLLVTHRHADHFSPELTIQLLANQTDCKLVAHKQAVDKMREVEGFKKIESQVIEITSDFGSHSKKSLNGIDVDVFCMKHGPYIVDGQNIHEQIRNLAYIVDMEGVRFYHSGDAKIDDNSNVFKKYDFIKSPVDLMFLQPYDISPESKEFINKIVNPDKIIAMHISPNNVKAIKNEFIKHYPGSYVFEKQGGKYHFVKKFNSKKNNISYFGQEPPEGVAEVFGPNIISKERLEHSAPAFSPDCKEAYWSVIRKSNDSTFQEILFTKYKNGKWTEPKRASFSTGNFYEGGPVISADSKRLYIYRGIPAPPGGIDRPIYIICYTKTEEGWGNPVTLGEGVFHSVADNGNIYFTKGRSIGRIKLINGKYSEPELLDEKINNPDFQNWTPYIAPDESYLIFSRLDFNGDYGELMISFYDKENDVWNESLNLGSKVNSKNQERFPSISNDGKFLFFTRPRDGYSQDIWWVKTEMIEELKTKISK